jgi:hypothetical protein
MNPCSSDCQPHHLANEPSPFLSRLAGCIILYPNVFRFIGYLRIAWPNLKEVLACCQKGPWDQALTSAARLDFGGQVSGEAYPKKSEVS